MANFLGALDYHLTTTAAFPSPWPVWIRAINKLVSNRITYGGWWPWGADVPEGDGRG